MALLTPTVPGVAGSTADLVNAINGVAAAGGDSFLISGNDVLFVNNGSGSAITLTISTVAANVPDNFGIVNAAHDLTLNINAGKIGVVWNVNKLRFADSNGNAQIRYSASASVTVAVFKTTPT